MDFIINILVIDRGFEFEILANWRLSHMTKPPHWNRTKVFENCFSISCESVSSSLRESLRILELSLWNRDLRKTNSRATYRALHLNDEIKLHSWFIFIFWEKRLYIANKQQWKRNKKEKLMSRRDLWRTNMGSATEVYT